MRPKPEAVNELAAIKSGGKAAASSAGKVSRKWRQSRVLTPAAFQIGRSRQLVDMEDVAVRTRISFEHPELLPRGRFLDRDLVLSSSRKFTQRLGRVLYESGVAGLLYGSKLYGLCAALFERRARLVAAGPSEPLAGAIPDLERVCQDLGLTLV